MCNKSYILKELLNKYLIILEHKMLCGIPQLFRTRAEFGTNFSAYAVTTAELEKTPGNAAYHIWLKIQILFHLRPNISLKNYMYF